MPTLYKDPVDGRDHRFFCRSLPPPQATAHGASKYNPVERRCSQQTERPTRNTDYTSVLSTWQFSDHICRQYASFYSISCLPDNSLTMLTANILGFTQHAYTSTQQFSDHVFCQYSGFYNIHLYVYPAILRSRLSPTTIPGFTRLLLMLK